MSLSVYNEKKFKLLYRESKSIPDLMAHVIENVWELDVTLKVNTVRVPIGAK